MEDISDRISRLTQELRALHLQLQWPNFQDATPGDQNRILNHLLNSGLGRDLKGIVDLLSQFLWCYIESAAAKTNAEDVDYAQQSVLLSQVTEMLRLLHHSSCPLMESLAFVEHTTMTVARQAESPKIRNTLAMGKSA
ncbi:MAG TPA: hypothetical protein VFF39_16445 [Verrucomicrobiae bacterium]|jgi:hypothetical protein|nr:hypothetical protein [Verrucomicrobiae bacterium]